MDLDDDAVGELEEPETAEADLREHACRGQVLDAAAADQLGNLAAVERLVARGRGRLGGDALAPA